jgi:hypothetical protein
MDRRAVSSLARELSAARSAGDEQRVSDLERQLRRLEAGTVERAVPDGTP